SGVSLMPSGDAKPLPHTGGLVIERRIGRGRIVSTAFRLTQRELWVNWPSFDGFLNACLLRRPARSFSDPGSAGLSVDWAGETHHSAADPLLVTQLRFLSRDWDGKAGFTSAKWAQRAAPSVDEIAAQQQRALELDPVPMSGPGVGGWNDFGA